MRPPRRLTWAQVSAVERFAAKVGIGPVFRPAPCFGYANCCRCPACEHLERQIRERGFTDEGKIAPPPRPRQPWDPQ